MLSTMRQKRRQTTNAKKQKQVKFYGVCRREDVRENNCQSVFLHCQNTFGFHKNCCSKFPPWTLWICQQRHNVHYSCKRSNATNCPPKSHLPSFVSMNFKYSLAIKAPLAWSYIISRVVHVCESPEHIENSREDERHSVPPSLSSWPWTVKKQLFPQKYFHFI